MLGKHERMNRSHEIEEDRFSEDPSLEESLDISKSPHKIKGNDTGTTIKESVTIKTHK